MSEQGEKPRKRSPLLVLFLVVMIDLIGFGIVLPLLPRYAEQYDAGPATQGLLMAAFSAMQFLIAPLWGRLSDRYGRRPILMIGLVGSVIAYTTFAFANSLTLLFVSRIAAGAFGATIGTAAAYIADVTTQEQRGRGMALIGAAFGLGFTIGPAIGGLSHGWSPHAPGLIAAGLSAGALLLAVGSLPEPARHAERAQRKLLDTTAIRHALATPTVPVVLLLQFVATFAFANFEGTLSLFTDKRWGYDESENGVIFTFVGLSLVIAQGAIVRRIMPKVGETNLVIGGALLMAIGLSGVAWAPTLVPLLIALFTAVLGFSMVTPSLTSLLSLRTSPSTQGEILGLGQSMLSLARVLGPFVGNVLFGVRPTLPEWTATAILGGAFVLALSLRGAPQPEAAAAERSG